MIQCTLNGFCLEYDFRALVITGVETAEVAARSKWPILAQGEINLHLGVALFDRPFVFTPTHLITERQQTIAARRHKSLRAISILRNHPSRCTDMARGSSP
jgi:hypothetical protein